MSASPRILLQAAALTVAFSPVVLDVFRSLREDVGHRYVLLTPILIGSLLLHGVEPAPTTWPRRTGALLIGVGIALELIGLGSGTAVVARLGLPVAFLGFAVLSGWPDPRIALLGFGLVPLPDFVKILVSPDAEILIARFTARFWTLFGASIDAAGPILTSRGRSLDLVPGDSGLVTAVLLAQYGAYRAVRHGQDLAREIIGAIRAALGVVVLQPILSLSGIGLLLLGEAALGRFVLSHGLAIGIALLVVATHRESSASPVDTTGNSHGSPR